MDALVILIPLLPCLAAAIIGTGCLLGILPRNQKEGFTADVAMWLLVIATLMAIALLVGDLLGKNHGYFSVGQWLNSDTLTVRINFTTSGFSLWLVVLLSTLLIIIGRFAATTLHHQAGFHGFFAAFSLFSSAVFIVVLSANLVGTFFGWTLAEWAAYALLGCHYQQRQTSANGTRIIISQRVGDAGLVMGISLCYAWTDSVNWAQLHVSATELSIGQATGISLCFALAAIAKAAQLPFSPWLRLSLTEAFPVSLIMIHLGVYLLLLSEAVFMQSPFARALIGLVGIATVAYCYIIGKTQTTQHGAMLFATLAQVGLMFLECCFGLWELASWHLCANLTVACWQRLTIVDGEITLNQPQRAVPVRWYLMSLQQGWLDAFTDWVLVKPVRGLAQDLSYVDDRVIDRLVGLPSADIIPLRTNTDEFDLSEVQPPFPQSSGVAGKLTEWLSTLFHWFEQQLVLRVSGKTTSLHMRQAGHAINQFEQIILRPRYLVLFVCVTFLVAI